MRVWFSGRTLPCQGKDAGSIPATRSNKITQCLLGVFVILVTEIRTQSSKRRVFGMITL
jgi:hypothetical protein